VVVGLLGVVALPVAVLATRWSSAYELLQAGFAIPVAAFLGLTAIRLARRDRHAGGLLVVQARPPAAARLGWWLGVVALALAASATLSLAVYGVLTYLGERGA
jgi:hypothetical protein